MRITLSDQKFLPLFDTIIETHLMNTFNVMPNYLTVSNNTILRYRNCLHQFRRQLHNYEINKW